MGKRKRMSINHKDSLDNDDNGLEVVKKTRTGNCEYGGTNSPPWPTQPITSPQTPLSPTQHSSSSLVAPFSPPALATTIQSTPSVLLPCKLASPSSAVPTTTSSAVDVSSTVKSSLIEASSSSSTWSSISCVADATTAVAALHVPLMSSAATGGGGAVSVTTSNNSSSVAEPAACRSLRVSARVLKKLRKEEEEKTEVSSGSKKTDLTDEEDESLEPNKKRRRQWELWSAEDKDLFFEAINECGKSFEAIQNYLCSKLRKKGVQNFHIKNRDQVRHFYYRTWHKISKYLPFVGVVKKSTQEVYGLVNYGEFRRRFGGTLDVRRGLKLRELVMQGATSLRYKGRTVRIRTPVCRALKKFIQSVKEEDDATNERLPCTVSVCVSAGSKAAWTHVHGLAHNPRVKAILPLDKPLQSLFQYLSSKWRINNLKMRESILDGSNYLVTVPEVVEPVIRLRPPTNASVTVTHIRKYENNKPTTVLSLSAFEARLKSSNGSKVCPSSSNDSSSIRRRKRKKQHLGNAGDRQTAAAGEEEDEGAAEVAMTTFAVTTTAAAVGETVAPLDDHHFGGCRGEMSQEDTEEGSEGEDGGVLYGGGGRQGDKTAVVGERNEGKSLPSSEHCPKVPSPSSPSSGGGGMNTALQQLLELEYAATHGYYSTTTTTDAAPPNDSGAAAMTGGGSSVCHHTEEEDEEEDLLEKDELEKDIKENVEMSPEEIEMKIEAVKKGWTLEDVGRLTVGELYIMLGRQQPIHLEYEFELPLVKNEMREEDNNNTAASCAGVADHSSSASMSSPQKKVLDRLEKSKELSGMLAQLVASSKLLFNNKTLAAVEGGSGALLCACGARGGGTQRSPRSNSSNNVASTRSPRAAVMRTSPGAVLGAAGSSASGTTATTADATTKPSSAKRLIGPPDAAAPAGVLVPTSRFSVAGAATTNMMEYPGAASGGAALMSCSSSSADNKKQVSAGGGGEFLVPTVPPMKTSTGTSALTALGVPIVANNTRYGARSNRRVVQRKTVLVQRRQLPLLPKQQQGVTRPSNLKSVVQQHRALQPKPLLLESRQVCRVPSATGVLILPTSDIIARTTSASTASNAISVNVSGQQLLTVQLPPAPPTAPTAPTKVPLPYSTAATEKPSPSHLVLTNTIASSLAATTTTLTINGGAASLLSSISPPSSSRFGVAASVKTLPQYLMDGSSQLRTTTSTAHGTSADGGLPSITSVTAATVSPVISFDAGGGVAGAAAINNNSLLEFNTGSSSNQLTALMPNFTSLTGDNTSSSFHIPSSTPIGSPDKSNSLLSTPKISLRPQPVKSPPQLQLLQNATKNFSSLLSSSISSDSVPELHILQNNDANLPVLDISLGASLGFDDARIQVRHHPQDLEQQQPFPSDVDAPNALPRNTNTTLSSLTNNSNDNVTTTNFTSFIDITKSINALSSSSSQQQQPSNELLLNTHRASQFDESKILLPSSKPPVNTPASTTPPPPDGLAVVSSLLQRVPPPQVNSDPTPVVSSSAPVTLPGKSLLCPMANNNSSSSSDDHLFDITLGNSNSNSSFSSLLAASATAAQPLVESQNSSLLSTPPRRNLLPALSTTPTPPPFFSVGRLSPPSSPSRLIPREDQAWLGNEGADFSLTSLLGSFESSPSKNGGGACAVVGGAPLQNAPAPPAGVGSSHSSEAVRPIHRLSLSNTTNDSLLSVLNENGVDFTAKFDALSSSGDVHEQQQ